MLRSSHTDLYHLYNWIKILQFFNIFISKRDSTIKSSKNSLFLYLIDIETCNLTVVHAIETRVFLFLEAAPRIINFRATLISRRGGREGGPTSISLVALVTTWHKTQPGCSSLGRHRTFTRYTSPGRAYIRNPTNEWMRRGNDAAPRYSSSIRRGAIVIRFRVGPPTIPCTLYMVHWSVAWWSRFGMQTASRAISRANDILFLEEEARVSFSNCTVKKASSCREKNTLSILEKESQVLKL